MPLWLATAPFVVAAQSAARRALLQSAGVAGEVRPAEIDERGLEAVAPAQAPEAVAALLACAKASAVARRLPGRLVIGADQVLSLDGKRFGKPADHAAARAQLRALC